VALIRAIALFGTLSALIFRDQIGKLFGGFEQSPPSSIIQRSALRQQFGHGTLAVGAIGRAW
jgi:hypothetical protein